MGIGIRKHKTGGGINMINEVNTGITDVVSIHVSKMPEKVMMARANNQVAMFLGPAGIGKTRVTLTKTVELVKSADEKRVGHPLKTVFTPTPNDWLDENNFCVSIINLSGMEEADVNGIPYNHMIDGVPITIYAPTERLPAGNHIKASGILFFDEVLNAPSRVCTAFQTAFLDRIYSIRYKIPDHIVFIGASNRPGDGCNINLPGMAFRDRCAWFEVYGDDSPKAWVNTMRKIGKPVNNVLAGFLLSPIGAKYWDTISTNIKSGKFAFSTPRKLEFASNTMDYLYATYGTPTMERISEDVGGQIGAAAGNELANFIQLSININMDELLDNPELLNKYDKDIGTLYSIFSTLVMMAKNEKTAHKVFSLMNRNINKSEFIEFGVYLFSGILREQGVNKFVLWSNNHPNGNDISKKFNEYLM